MSQWKLVPLSKVDANRWDSCVRSRNGEVFAEFWYWNAVCKSWQAWVKGDYEDVIALPIERKWGIVPIMRTPLYVKWLEGEAEQLHHLIQSFFGFRKVHCMFEMKGAQKRQFQRFDLQPDWMPTRELVKNIRKAEIENPQYVQSLNWQQYADFMSQNHPYEWPVAQQETMRKLYETASERGVGNISGVKMNDEWAAMQFYIRDESRAYLIQNAVSVSKRNREPMPFLLHTLFLEWLRELKSVDVHFMGSNNPGVARFNEKFGAKTIRYWEFS